LEAGFNGSGDVMAADGVAILVPELPDQPRCSKLPAPLFYIVPLCAEVEEMEGDKILNVIGDRGARSQADLHSVHVPL
jgi:hypothetical protein